MALCNHGCWPSPIAIGVGEVQSSEFAQDADTSAETGNGEALHLPYMLWQNLIEPVDSNVGNLRWNK